jgi:16S rRNA (cytosine1402-N4)-methyltransferase
MHQNKNKNLSVRVKKKAQTDMHIPVLLEEVLQTLAPKEGESYLDLTAGFGGHATAIIGRTEAWKRAVLIDRDKEAIDYLQERFKGTGVRLHNQNFMQASQELVSEHESFDIILADLGVSSMHLNEASRGFAISSEGPLDMRMDQSQELTAQTIVNTYSEAELEKLLREYGEEPQAKKIANWMVENRPITTTSQLSALVARAWPTRSRRHPATRTFQALRIAVNEELKLLELSLPIWFELLNPGGRLGVISFHSLEDRIVKRALANVSGDRYDADFRLLNRHPITASPEEIVFNPRSRSAKFRGVVKIKTS